MSYLEKHKMSSIKTAYWLFCMFYPLNYQSGILRLTASPLGSYCYRLEISLLISTLYKDQKQCNRENLVVAYLH